MKETNEDIYLEGIILHVQTADCNFCTGLKHANATPPRILLDLPQSNKHRRPRAESKSILVLNTWSIPSLKLPMVQNKQGPYYQDDRRN